jgi:uridine kinase
VAERVARTGPGRLRVAVDGLTGAGKTSFGHELAAALIDNSDFAGRRSSPGRL